MKIHEATKESVDLNPAETKTREWYEYYHEFISLDTQAAAEAALAQHKGTPSKQFVEWLSGDTLTKVDGKVVPKILPAA